MALIVEDGTGLLVAESYVSVVNANLYHSAMGNTLWDPLSEGVKEIALRRATQYIDSEYQFVGALKNYNQALQFPRYLFQDEFLSIRYDNIWPIVPVRDACCELALRAHNTSLIVDVDASTIKFEKVGPIETEFFRSQSNNQIRYQIADRLLKQFTIGRGGLRIVRAS